MPQYSPKEIVAEKKLPSLTFFVHRADINKYK